jgi:hypothetical protein
MTFQELLELKNDYKQYNNDDFYSLREFIEIFEEWEQDNRNLFYTLVQTLDIDFSRAIGIIGNCEYTIYDSLEDYIYESLGEEGIELPNWVCINAYHTWFYSLRYEDNLYFMDDMPQFAKNSEEYGDSKSRENWLEGIRYLVNNSKMILLQDWQ